MVLLWLKWHRFFSDGTIINDPALVQIMLWRRTGTKPLSWVTKFTDEWIRHSASKSWWRASTSKIVSRRNNGTPFTKFVTSDPELTLLSDQDKFIYLMGSREEKWLPALHNSCTMFLVRNKNRTCDISKCQCLFGNVCSAINKGISVIRSEGV